MKQEIKAMTEKPENLMDALFIQQSIQNAENAIKANDVIKMIAAYQDLKEIE